MWQKLYRSSKLIKLRSGALEEESLRNRATKAAIIKYKAELKAAGQELAPSKNGPMTKDADSDGMLGQTVDKILQLKKTLAKCEQKMQVSDAGAESLRGNNVNLEKKLVDYQRRLKVFEGNMELLEERNKCLNGELTRCLQHVQSEKEARVNLEE